MKKLNFFKVTFLLITFPVWVFAQNVQLPTVEISVSADKVPARVKDAFLKDFGPDHQPMVWATSQSKFDTYGWEQTVNVSNQEVYDYILHTKTTNGSTLDAVYTPDGKLIRSREEVKNFEPPQVILASLEKSQYKDWKIAKDVHLIKTYETGKSMEHYDLKLEKGNQKKSVYFDKSGKMLMNKKRI